LLTESRIRTAFGLEGLKTAIKAVSLL